MGKNTVQALKEVSKELPDGDSICLQQVIYNYSDGTNSDPSFRFIRRDIRGHLKAQRGQASIPSLGVMRNLMTEMNDIRLRFDCNEVVL